MNTRATLAKPCDDCSTNIDQAMYQDEVTCYKTCKAFKEWQDSRNAKEAHLAIEM